jgi:hypothetical protein
VVSQQPPLTAPHVYPLFEMAERAAWCMELALVMTPASMVLLAAPRPNYRRCPSDDPLSHREYSLSRRVADRHTLPSQNGSATPVLGMSPEPSAAARGNS